MNFDVIHNNTSIKNLVIEYQTQRQICSGVGSLQLTVPIKSRSFNPYDQLKIYENEKLVGIFYVSEIVDDFQTGETLILAQDGSKKLSDYYFADNSYYTTPTTCKFWIQKILDEAGIDYQFTVSGSGNIIPPNTPIGPGNAFELVTSLLQQSGWYIVFDQNNVANIGKIIVDEEPKLTFFDDQILNLTYSKDSDMLRNRAIVWGSVDTRTMETVSAKAEKWTGYEMTSMDWRTVVVASPYIYYKEDAQAIANLLVKEFAKITEIKSVDIAGFTDVTVGDTVGIESKYWSGIGLITTKRVFVSNRGVITNLVIDERCPRIFTYFGSKFVYLGTDGAGVWKKPISYPYATWINFSGGIDEEDLVIRDLSVFRGVFCCIGGNNVYRRTSASLWKKLTLPEQNIIPTGCKVTESFIYVIGTKINDETTVILTYSRSGNLISQTDFYVNNVSSSVIGYDIDYIDGKVLVTGKLSERHFEPNTEDNTLLGNIAPESPIGIFNGYLYTFTKGYNYTDIYKIGENDQYRYRFYGIEVPNGAAVLESNILTITRFQSIIYSNNVININIQKVIFNLATMTYSQSTETVNIPISSQILSVCGTQKVGILYRINKIILTIATENYAIFVCLIVSSTGIDVRYTYSAYDFGSYTASINVYSPVIWFVTSETEITSGITFGLRQFVYSDDNWSYFNDSAKIYFVELDIRDDLFSSVQSLKLPDVSTKQANRNPGACNECTNPFTIGLYQFSAFNFNRLNLTPFFKLIYATDSIRPQGQCTVTNTTYINKVYDQYGNELSTEPDVVPETDNNQIPGNTILWFSTRFVNYGRYWYIKGVVDNYGQLTDAYLVDYNLYSHSVYAYVKLELYFRSYMSYPKITINQDYVGNEFYYSNFVMLWADYLYTHAIPISGILSYFLAANNTIIDNNHRPSIIEVKNNKILELPTGLSGIFIPTFYKSFSGKFPDDIRYSIASGYPIPSGIIESGFDELDNYWDLDVLGAAINLTDAKFYTLDLNNITPAASGLIYIVANGKLVTVDIPEKAFVSQEALPSGFYPYKVEVLANEMGIFVAGSGQFYEKTPYTNGLYYPASGNIPNVMPTVLRTDDAI